MTERASGEARRRRPLARISLLAIPGGMMVGAIVGVEYSLLYTVQELLFTPAWAGGTGSPGLSLLGALLGLAVGTAVGFVVGIATCVSLAAAWLLRMPHWCVVVIGSLGLLTSAVLFIGVTVSLDPATLLVPVWGSSNGIAGVVLLAWVAQLRPHDYWDEIERRRENEICSVSA